MSFLKAKDRVCSNFIKNITSKLKADIIKTNSAISSEVKNAPILYDDLYTCTRKYIRKRKIKNKYGVGSNGYLTERVFNEQRFKKQREHTPETMNLKQKAVFDYVIKDPKTIIALNAPPGTGKSYTLKTIAGRCTPHMEIIIYKHDLLVSFIHLAIPMTNASFFMDLLCLSFFQLKAVDSRISINMTGNAYLMITLELLRMMCLRVPQNLIYVFDECTVANKLLLVTTIMYLKKYKRTVVLCGDNNQLGAIHDGKHSRSISTFELIKPMAEVSFTLQINERCKDEEYNKLIGFIGSQSNSDPLNDELAAYISMRIFYAMITPDSVMDIHMGYEYRHITLNLHQKYLEDDVLRVPYMVRKGEYLVQCPEAEKYQNTTNVGKFFYYIPLIIGMEYYHKTLNEDSIKTLIEIDKYVLTLRDSRGEKVDVTMDRIGTCIIENHREYLSRNEEGALYGFPIYPTNIMSSHMSQGCTINRKISINLKNATNRAAYVMFSRATGEDKISRVVLENGLNYLLSAIIAQKDLCSTNKPSHESCIEALKTYKKYNAIPEVMPLISNFCMASYAERPKIRKEIKKLISSQNGSPLDKVESDETIQMESTLEKIIKNESLIMKLANLPPPSAAIWVNEYSKLNFEFQDFLVTDESTKQVQNDLFFKTVFWYAHNENTLEYITRLEKFQSFEPEFQYFTKTCKTHPTYQYFLKKFENVTEYNPLDTSMFTEEELLELIK